MPRVRRRGKTRRCNEAPLSEWPVDELKAELNRLEANPEDLNPWQILKRKSELQNELFKRTGRD